MCRVHPLDRCQGFCKALRQPLLASWRDSSERRRMEVVVVEEEEVGVHWSLSVPPTMHHGRQGVT